MTMHASLKEAVQTCLTGAANNPGVEFAILRDDISGEIISANNGDQLSFARIVKTVKARYILGITYTVKDEEHNFVAHEPRSHMYTAFNPSDAEQFADSFA